MASAPAVVTPPPLGSTRLMHVYNDWSQANNAAGSNFGPGQSIPWQLDRANQNSTAPARGGAWNNLSGVNKQNGRVMAFLQATSFNIGIFSNYIVPIVGGNPSAAPTLSVAENAQYYAWNFKLAQGGGIAQSGYTPINPPYTPATVDVGIFFFPADFGISASSYGQFSDNGGNGSEQGFGFFLATDGTWHYGIRYRRVISPLDIDVPLPAGPGVAQWPVPVIAGVPDFSQYAALTLEFIAATGAGDSLYRATLGGKQLLQTTFARIGAAPVGVGLTAQLPDFYSESSLCYGIIGCIRAGNGTGTPVQTFPLCFNQLEFTNGPNLPSTFPSF
jgi:hypothetical protein